VITDFDSINEGDFVVSLKKEAITQLQLIRYAGASGDFNPIHTIPENAKEAGLDNTIAHGMLIMGFIGEMITKNFNINNIKKFSVSFKNITKLGEKLEAKAIVKRKITNEDGNFAELRVFIDNEAGEIKADGKVLIYFEDFSAWKLENVECKR